MKQGKICIKSYQGGFLLPLLGFLIFILGALAGFYYLIYSQRISKTYNNLPIVSSAPIKCQSTCPQFMPPAPDFCKNGTIVLQGKDECGCQLLPECLDTSNWKTFTITPDSSLGYEGYQLKLPNDWEQIEHSSNFQDTEQFQDRQKIYKLSVREQENYNSQTNKPYTNLKEFLGLSYDVKTLTVDRQTALRPLPRAGSENIYKAVFFSASTKIIYSITLESPVDGSKIQEGASLFNQILSTFKFYE